MLEFFRFILEFYRRYSLVVGNMPIDKDVCGDILGASAHMSESAEGITLVLTLILLCLSLPYTSTMEHC